ncbi:MAG: segregation/condensation protein A [Lachnospiraceae bacterium]|nr:segregation/condensation protein A [Lachnospiraceae bacterium]
MDLSVKLEVFEGPLDLLLHLLDKNKVSIYDIPIVEITDQYLEYIREMQRQDLNIMSEFMVMAATLLDIKARWLLPKEESEDEEEEDPRAELVEQLLQYKMYKYMSMELKDRQMDAAMQLFRSPDLPDQVREYEEPVDLDKLTEGLDLRALHRIFQSVMSRQAEKVDPIRSKFGKIEKEQVSVEDKLSYLESFLETHRSCSFRELLERQNSRIEVVVTFLAVLELMKMGEITAQQDEIFGEIEIVRTDRRELAGEDAAEAVGDATEESR